MKLQNSRSKLPLFLLSAAALLGLVLGGWLFHTDGQSPLSEDTLLALRGDVEGRVRQESTPVVGQPQRRGAESAPGMGDERPVADFHLEFRSLTQLSQGQDQQSIDLSFECTGRLTELDTRDGERILELRMPELAIRLLVAQGAVDSSQAEAALRQPVLIRLAADGRILGYRFSTQLRREWRNTIRSLYASLRSPQSGLRWEGREGDAGGMASLVVESPAASAVDAEREVRWVRTGYDAPAKHGIRPQMRGEGRSRHATSIWPRESAYEERQEIVVPMGDVKITQELRVRSELVSESLERLQVPAGLWEGEWEPASGEADALASDEEDDASSDALDSLAFHLSSLQQFVHENRKDTPEFYDAFQRLVDQLVAGALDPEEVRRMLMDPSLDPQLARILAGAAGAAGTPALQNVLIDVAKTVHLDMERRSSALVALVQVVQPDTQAGQGLLALIQDPNTDSELRTASLYMLGAFAGRADADPLLFDQLLALESMSTTEGTLRQFLNALGNVGNMKILPTLERYLQHGDASLRAAAVDALRRLDSPDAFASLSQLASTDPSPQVRAEALGSLEKQPATLALPLLATALEDGDVSVRRAAVQALGQRDEPEATTLLQQARDRDPAPAVRSLASKLLL